MGGRGGRLPMLEPEIARFLGMESAVDEDDKTDGGGGGGESQPMLASSAPPGVSGRPAMASVTVRPENGEYIEKVCSDCISI